MSLASSQNCILHHENWFLITQNLIAKLEGRLLIFSANTLLPFGNSTNVPSIPFEAYGQTPRHWPSGYEHKNLLRAFMFPLYHKKYDRRFVTGLTTRWLFRTYRTFTYRIRLKGVDRA